MYSGLGSGTKNSAAVRSGIPISQRVGPFLGSWYTIWFKLIWSPASIYISVDIRNQAINSFIIPSRFRQEY